MTKHARVRQLAASGRRNPPPGRNDDRDTQALRAGDKAPTQRRSATPKEPPTRDAGRDDRRSGSDSGKP